MNSEEVRTSLCPNCGLPIHSQDTVRHGYGGPAHTSSRCIQLLQMRIDEAKRLLVEVQDTAFAGCELSERTTQLRADIREWIR